MRQKRKTDEDWIREKRPAQRARHAFYLLVVAAEAQLAAMPRKDWLAVAMVGDARDAFDAGEVLSPDTLRRLKKWIID